MGRRYLLLSSRCFCRLKKIFRLCSCRFDSFGMLVLLLVKGWACSATHPSRATKPKIRILGIVVRKGCVALHYSVHFFFTIYLCHATIIIEGEGVSARSPICVSAPTARENEGIASTPASPLKLSDCSNCFACAMEVPQLSRRFPTYRFGISFPPSPYHAHIRSYMVEWEETAPYTHLALSSVPHFLERLGQTHKRCGNRTDLAPIPSPSIMIVARKRKIVKKVDGVV